MQHFNWRKLTLAIIGLIVAGAALLWSWNALAGLFGAPTAQFRHAFAALVLVYIARALLSPRHTSR